MSFSTSLFLGESSMMEGRQVFPRVFLGRTLLQGWQEQAIFHLLPRLVPCHCG